MFVRFDFLFYNFPHYAQLTVRFITCTMEGEKIPFNKELEKTLFNMGLEFTKQKTKHIFQESEGDEGGEGGRYRYLISGDE